MDDAEEDPDDELPVEDPVPAVDPPDDPEVELEDPLEDPELPEPDEPELGGVEGAGGGVTDVGTTTGLEELPAVVAVDPYSNAPISQIVPRS